MRGKKNDTNNRKKLAARRRWNSPDRTTLTDEIVARIEAEIARTGVAPHEIERPNQAGGSLKRSKIKTWRRRRVETASREELNTFFDAYSRLPDNPRIPITPELRDRMRKEIERTGVSPSILFPNTRCEGDVSPRGNTVWLWMNGNIKSAPREHVAYVLEKWRTLPDEYKVTITPEQRRELRRHMERTGIGPHALMRGVRPSAPDRVQPNTIKQWLSGTVRSAKGDAVQHVLERWRALPDQDDIYMTVTDQHVRTIRDELRRTGLSQKQLFRQAEDFPETLTFGIFLNFITGKVSRFRKNDYDCLLRFLHALPDRLAPPVGSESLRSNYKGRITLTDGMHQTLHDERERTGIGVTALVRIMRAEGVVPFTRASTLEHWLGGHVKTVPEAQYQAVLTAWRALPDSKKR